MASERRGLLEGLSGGPHSLSWVKAHVKIPAGAVNLGYDISQGPSRVRAAHPPTSLSGLDLGDGMLCVSRSWHLVPIAPEVGVHRL